MRALFFGDTPHRLAGAQKQLLAALLLAPEFGVDPHIVFPAAGAFEGACREAGLRVTVLDAPPAFQSFGKALLKKSWLGQAGVVTREVVPYSMQLARLIDRDKADVVHFNTSRGILMAGLAAQMTGRNTVLHVRGLPTVARRHWLVSQAMAQRFVLVAKAIESYLLPTVRPKSSVAYDGVDLPDPVSREAARRAVTAPGGPAAGLPIGPDTLVFVSLSSLVPFKGLHHLLEAAAKLKQRGIAAQFLLASTGLEDAYEAWLRRRRDELGLQDCVHFIGFVRQPDTLLAAADVFVLPTVNRERLVFDDIDVTISCTEGFPRSVIEAMAVGRPILATAVAGLAEQVDHGETGLLVPPSDPGAMADALERFAREPEWRERAGAAARQVVATRFTVREGARGLAEALIEARAEPTIGAGRALELARIAREGLAEWRGLPTESFV